MTTSPFATIVPPLNIAVPVPETYGSVYTSQVAGTIMAFNPPTGVESFGFHWNGFTNGAEFAITLAQFTSLTNTQEPSGTLQSVAVAYTYYSDATHKMTQSITTATVVDPTSGPLSGDETLMLVVTDATSHAVLYTTVAPLPVTMGWCSIVA